MDIKRQIENALDKKLNDQIFQFQKQITRFGRSKFVLDCNI